VFTKADLIQAVGEKLACSNAEAQRAVEAVLDSVEQGLVAEKRVQLTGFGTFEVRQRQARVGRNPKTGMPINIPASTTVGFRPGKAFKNLV